MGHSEVFSMMEKEQDYVIDILRNIISIDTTVPPGENYGKLIDLLEPEFKKFGFTTKRVTVPESKLKEMPSTITGERVNLIASMNNGKPKASVYSTRVGPR